jgi:hypothetical protein
MRIKFNGGYGALLCNKCNIIIAENFTGAEWDFMERLKKKGCKVLCEECSKKVLTKKESEE